MDNKEGFQMKHSQKAKIIACVCMVLVGVFTVFMLFRSTFSRTKDLDYEQIDMEKAVRYMSYEKDYVLLDVSPEEDYEAYHIPGAVSVPYEELESYAAGALTDKDQMIYVCSSDGKESRKGANLLCELGYTNITEIGQSGEYEAASEAAASLFSGGLQK